jgi:hypothetical protein
MLRRSRGTKHIQISRVLDIYARMAGVVLCSWKADAKAHAQRRRVAARCPPNWHQGAFTIHGFFSHSLLQLHVYIDAMQLRTHAYIQSGHN